MKSENKILKTEFYRAIFSCKFWISLLGIIVICYLNNLEEFRYVYSEEESTREVVYYFDLMLGFGAFKNMILIVASLSIVSSFVSDWNNQFIRSIVIRSGMQRYGWSKVIVNATVAFVTTFIGLMGFVITINIVLRIPLVIQNTDSGAILSQPYGYLLMGDFPIIYFVAKSFLISISTMFWCTLGMYISTLIPNYFVALSAPFLSYYLLCEITENFPIWLNLRCMAYGFDVLGKDAWITVLYTFAIFSILTIFIGHLFVKNVKRRVGNELV